MHMTPIAEALAHFAIHATRDELPDNVTREAARAWLNWTGCAIGGAATDIARCAIRGAVSFDATRPHDGIPLLGRTERLGLEDSALVNCLQSSAQTFDDTHLDTITHPTGPVAAALLACTQATKTDGASLLLALAIGIEIECRISRAIVAAGSGAHQGWFITGVSGGIGAAAAVCRVRGLDVAQTASALGLAATQACGLRATHGSMAIAYVPGLAARNGLAAACLAAAGFTCGAHAIDGKNGLFEVIAPNADRDSVTRDLYSMREFFSNAYKPYPCGIVIHPAIDACIEVASRDGWRADEVERVELRVHEDALNLCWRKLPETALDAQVSLYHWVAVALATGRAGLAQGAHDAVWDARVRALQARIGVHVDPALAKDQAVLRVTMRDGTTHHASVVHATGSIANPMTDAALDDKFRELVRSRFDGPRTEALLRMCRHIEASEDAGEVGRSGALS